MQKLFLCVLLISLSAFSWSDISFIQNINMREQLGLGGQWNIIVDPYENGDRKRYFENRKVSSPSDLIEYNYSTSQKIQVPGDWNSQSKELFRYEGAVWYQRDFTQKKQPKKNYVLYFSAVNYHATVYLNGEKLGEHEGGFTPFNFNATGALVDGENSVVVKVNNRREPTQIPTMSTDWWNYGGITRPVSLLQLNERYLQDYSLTYSDENGSKIEATFQVDGAHSGASSKSAIEWGSLRLRIPALEVDQSVELDKRGRADLTIAARPDLWTPDAPKLYDVYLEYQGETIKDRIGFRTIAVDGTDILLNDQAIFLRGISIHEEKPFGEGRAWSEEHARTLLGWAKEMGCNYVRLAHYPHNEAMLRVADEMGLLVWAEIPVYWDVLFDKKEVYLTAEQQLQEMISRDKNRASIILWSVANETPKNKVRTRFLKKLIDKARALDPSRLVTAAINTNSTTEFGRRIDDPLASLVDVIGINTYCGWYYDTPEECANYRWESDYEKPVIVSEFGGGALQGWHGDKEQVFTEENQADIYRHNLAMLDKMSMLRGVSPWILKDFRSPRRPLKGIQDFWNRKGLLSETGQKKQAWYIMQEWYLHKANASK